MVVRRERKVRRFRGFRSYGFGSHKKHRGAGSRGGRGQAGLHKHKWSYTVKYDKYHFGKYGFKRPPEVVKIINAVNVSDIEKRIGRLLKEKIAVEEGNKIRIDVSKMGCDKVLGSGKINLPLIVEAKYFAKSAIKKIEDAGGKAVVTVKPKVEKTKEDEKIKPAKTVEAKKPVARKKTGQKKGGR